MNHDFDTFVKEHLQDILCEAEKERALASIKKVHKSRRMRIQLRIPPPITVPEVQLQDCAVSAVSPSFSQSHV
ncbi:MAG: hypothetical protein A2136_03015 [Chloroflexi bacterium RBG_16_54_11]|nr:MAG: hypothetical protein A2136_03015 [Chloroflexi bacterium RBG_16_54_11]